MQVLGVADCFERIIDIRAIDFACKPEPHSLYAGVGVGRRP